MKFLKINLSVDKRVVQETLNRIGVSNKKEKVLYPSCYIIEENDEYFLVHFKQLFSLSRNDAYENISEQDITRRNSIAFCLKNWGLIDVEDKFITPHNSYIFVLPYEDKDSWKVTHKINLYTLRQKHGFDI